MTTENNPATQQQLAPQDIRGPSCHERAMGLLNITSSVPFVIHQAQNVAAELARMLRTDLSADMVKREEFGMRKYGLRLRPHNGRDALVDAYQEALDLLAYLAQAELEGRI